MQITITYFDVILGSGAMALIAGGLYCMIDVIKDALKERKYKKPQ